MKIVDLDLWSMIIRTPLFKQKLPLANDDLIHGVSPKVKGETLYGWMLHYLPSWACS